MERDSAEIIRFGGAGDIQETLGGQSLEVDDKDGLSQLEKFYPELWLPF